MQAGGSALCSASFALAFALLGTFGKCGGLLNTVCIGSCTHTVSALDGGLTCGCVDRTQVKLKVKQCRHRFDQMHLLKLCEGTAWLLSGGIVRAATVLAFVGAAHHSAGSGRLCMVADAEGSCAVLLLGCKAVVVQTCVVCAAGYSSCTSCCHKCRVVAVQRELCTAAGVVAAQQLFECIGCPGRCIRCAAG